MSAAGAVLVDRFFRDTGRSYDRVVRWTTFGLDRLWKRALLDEVPAGGTVLELACGTGILTRRLLDRDPRTRVVGVDVTPGYLAVARERLAPYGDRAVLRLGDATTAPVDDLGPYDAVCASYLPKYVDAERLVAHVTPALRPGAVFAMHDFGRPPDAVPRALWRAWFASLRVAAPRVHPEWAPVFDGTLQRFLEESGWVEETVGRSPATGTETSGRGP
jgi:demethylmenaquinone methyltransferase/2-methoxy-6-polyprenyl-1,4-benzoquinol methylase